MKFFTKTIGCKVNQYETQLIREQLAAGGYIPVGEIEAADICVINSCTVTHGADADCRQMVRKALKANPAMRIIITGCLAATNPSSITKLSEQIEIYTDKNEIAKRLLSGSCLLPELISYFHGHTKAFVKIQDGCDAFCSYCIVPFARPKLWSKEKVKVMEEIGALVRAGYKEIVLCGIRLGKYSSGHGGPRYGLVELMRDILGAYPDQRLGLSSLEIMEISDDFIQLLADDDRISKHLHIPLQSGDDSILNAMRRPYTTAEYEKKVLAIRTKVPGVILTTDLIVGFPGETDAHFTNTLGFLKNISFNKIHIFRYSPRSGANAAARHDCVGSTEIKRRSKILEKLNQP